MKKQVLTTILDYLIASAPRVITERGLQVFQKGKVSLLKKRAPFFEFKVIGNSAAFYDVNFTIEPNQNTIDYYCSCPYAEGGLLCKHVVGAAYFLKSSPKVVSKSKTLVASSKRQTLKQPIELVFAPNKKFDTRSILKPIQVKKKNGLYNESIISSIELRPNLLKAELTAAYNNYYLEDSKATVEITFQKDRYLISCSDASHKGNCNHLKNLADYMFSQDNVNLLEQIDEEFFKNKAEKYFSDVGVALHGDEIPENLIYLKVIEGEIYVVPIGRLEGLVNPDGLGSFLDNSLIKILTDHREERLIPRENIYAEKDVLPALVWDLDSINRGLSEVISITGKPNKNRTKIVSYIQRLKSPFEDGISSHEDMTLVLLAKEKVNSILDNDQDDFQLWEALNQLFEESQDQIHYRRDPSVGENRRYWNDEDVPKKSELTELNSIHKNVRLKFKLYVEEGLHVFELYLELASGEVVGFTKNKIVTYSGHLLLVNNKDLLLLSSPKETLALQTFFPECVLKCTAKELPNFIQRIVEPIAKEFPVDFSNSGLNIEYQELNMNQNRVYISELNGFVILRPVVLYEEGHEINLLDDTTEMIIEGKEITLLQRSVDEEREFLEQLSDLHESFQPKTQQSYFFLSYSNFTKGHWFLKAFEKLKQLNVGIFGLESLKSLKFSPHTPSISMGMVSGQDWFETKLEVAFGNNKVTLSQLKKAVINGAGYVELKDGSLGILPEQWLKKFSKLFRTADVDNKNVRISKTHFNIIEDLVDEDISPAVYEEIQEKKKRLSRFTGIEQVEKPKALKATLRDYQQQGLNWLGFLSTYGWGGILADDMGLGKTLQALGLIAMELEKKPKKTSLVVAPTTLLFNWKNEIEKFAPDINYIIHHGDRKDDINELKKHHLVLTSYGVVVNDLELLKKIDFNLIIIDESQAIKNLNSKRYKAVCNLKGSLRVAMSGTPIENNIYELYAQMNFVNPGFFMGLTAFKKDYANTIERNDNKEIINELRNKISPFILRRTKEQVLTELPDKSEEYLYCEMNQAQRKVYDATRNEYRDYLLKKFDEEGVEKSQMYVLEGLTRLRQVCDSPLLIDKEGYDEKSSAKLDELVRHVLEKTGNHKILIFSQFVKMLQLIKEKFDEHNIVYEYLDGKTSVKEREKRVNNFQNDNNCRSFLISLKAGGTGLNLTSADYVYIVDPWWNPATENQAIDRCYRMGQTKKVMAYRMICKNTVEEKIIDLQNKKKSLSDDVVGQGGMKKLGRKDIESLFS